MSNTDSLPASWLELKLGDVVAYGATVKAEPHEIPADAWLLELEDIEKDTSKLLVRVTFGARRSRSTKNRFSAGDVLYGKLRPYLNKVIRADRGGFCTTEIIPLKSNDIVDGDYLFYWLRHPRFLDYVTNVSHGLNMPRLGTESGRHAPFVLAPIREQKRIAQKLDAIVTKIDACRERLDPVPQILKKFREAVLEAAVSGALTEEWRGESKLSEAALEPVLPFGWFPCEFADIVESSLYGPRFSSIDYINDGIPTLRTTDMNALGRIAVKDPPRVKVDAADYERLGLKDGDLVMTRTGATIGKCAVYDDSLGPALPSAYLIRFRFQRDRVVPRFALIFLLSPVGQRLLTAGSTSVAQPNINAQKIRTFPISLPPILEQSEIVRRADELFTLAERLQHRYEDGLASVEKLTALVLDKAFRGELVPQDPEDEPASVMLERIRKQREVAANVATLRKRGTGLLRRKKEGRGGGCLRASSGKSGAP